MSSGLDQLAALANAQNANIVVATSINEPYSPYTHLRAGGIKKLGDSWAFPVLCQGKTLVVVSRPFENQHFLVENTFTGERYGCDDLDLLLSAIHEITGPTIQGMHQRTLEAIDAARLQANGWIVTRDEPPAEAIAGVDRETGLPVMFDGTVPPAGPIFPPKLDGETDALGDD